MYLLLSYRITAWLRNYTEIDGERYQVINRNAAQHFSCPIGIAIGPKDQIFVLDCSNPKIIIFKQDLKTKDPTKEKIITLKGECEIKKPLGIAVGNWMIAVSDQNNNIV